MVTPASLEQALKDYEASLSGLIPAIQSSCQITQQHAALAALSARDGVQHFLAQAPTLSAEQLEQLNQLDSTLKSHKFFLVRAIDLSHWRSLLNPPETAWWWHFDPPALFPFLEKELAWLKRLNGLLTFASLFFLTLAVTVIFDTLKRVAGEGLSTQGIFPVVLQVLLTLAGGSAALTQNGRQWLRSLLTQWRIPKHYRQVFSTLLALSVWLFVMGIHEGYLPRLAAERYNDGIAHYEIGQFDSALQAYQQSMALRPDFVKGHYSLGLVYEDLQQREKAIAEYQRVVSQDPAALDKLTWLRAHNNLGRLYVLDEKFQTAWIPLERALDAITEAELADEEIRAEYYNLLKNLGWMWLGQEQLSEADDFLTQAIEENPRRAAAHCLKAQVLEEQEQSQAALPFWGSCLSEERNIQPEEATWAAIARTKLEAAIERGEEVEVKQEVLNRRGSFRGRG